MPVIVLTFSFLKKKCQILYFLNKFFFKSPRNLSDKMRSFRLKSVEVLNHLFEIGPGTGSDLISININRGRDHAIPPYMSYRKMCNLYTTKKFSGLVDHTQDVRELLAETYE